MSVITSTPGQLQVIKRNGEVATFDAEKISGCKNFFWMRKKFSDPKKKFWIQKNLG